MPLTRGLVGETADGVIQQLSSWNHFGANVHAAIIEEAAPIQAAAAPSCNGCDHSCRWSAFWGSAYDPSS